MSRLLPIRLPLLTAVASSLFLCLAITARPQDETEGEYLENAVVGRDLAVRIRGEIQFTETDMALIENDINYARFPSKLYNAEAKFIQNNGASARVVYSRWQNSQDYDAIRWSWKLRFPFKTGSGFRDVTESLPFLSIAYWNQPGDSENPELGYWYLGLDKTTQEGVYMLIQYRNATEDGQVTGHQLMEYVSWKASDRIRVGQQAAATKNDDVSGVKPWYGKVFGTAFLVPDKTSLRMEAFHYDSDSVSYQEYNAYLMQKIGRQSVARLNYRYYTDSDDLDSNAVGIKLKHFFSARVSAHVGYRLYDHTEDVNFDTFFGGFNILL